MSLLEEGYARAKALTRRHSKSFYFASLALFGERRRAAFALYAFCRHIDDIVDGEGGGAPSSLANRLEVARAAVASLYDGEEVSHGGLPWHASEWAAFRDVVQRYRIPQRPFDQLISGMEMDLTINRYADVAELDLYCYRVAGVVGLMMTYILGFRDAACLPDAVALGQAMQLTNILRDVREDFDRGRVYLPAEVLAAHGVTEADLRAGVVTDAWRALMQEQIARARTLYAQAERGIPYLTGFGSQRVVRLMAVIYGAILERIEALDYDVFRSRAYLPLMGKVQKALGVILGRGRFRALPSPAPSPARGLAR
jgi:15-cis-phytoene synthase